MNEIEALSERLGFLQITKEVSSKYEQTDTEMLIAPVPVPTMNNRQTTIPKSMVPDPG